MYDGEDDNFCRLNVLMVFAGELALWLRVQFKCGNLWQANVLASGQVDGD